MPWADGLGELPPMRPVTGESLAGMLESSTVLMLVGADELERPETSAAWHDFADLLSGLPAALRERDAERRVRLVQELEVAVAALRTHRVRVLAGAAVGMVFVAAIPFGHKRDLRSLFASA